MASLIPIPTTRVGDYFIRQRLVRQVQGDQLGLFQLQNQVSTGRRIIRPSDDAPAALRAIGLQRTIQRKEQAARNLAGSRSVLGAAETALNSVSDVLNDVRGAAIEAVSNLTSDASRQAAINTIDGALSALVTSGNSNYNGRYLFAGSRTSVAPFEQIGQFVQYNGNEKNLQNYVDLEQLFTTNLPGTEVFGGISGEVRGTADLNPELTTDSLLTSLNGGEGIDTNSAISVSVTSGGTTTPSIIDLSGAVTIGDVMRRIEAGSSVTVDIADNGLTLRTNSTDTIRVSEVAAGRAAKQLGILTPTSAVATPTVVGTDLDPVAEKTTPLANLFGTKASGRLPQTGSNNDLVLTAAVNGLSFDNVDVVYQDTATAGNETASYDSGTNTLTVQIASGVTTAQRVADVINAEGTFIAVPDLREATSSSLAGTGTVVATNFTDVTTGGSGEALDTASGLVLTNGGETVTLDISTAETLEDLFNLISGAQIGLAADLNAEGNGINVRSLLSGADFTIGENGGTTATQLGIRTYTLSTPLADLNRGVGVPTSDTANDLEIVARDGTVLSIDLTGATTVDDVLVRINTAAGIAGLNITAQLAAVGNGIEIVDATGGAGTLAVNGIEGSQAAEYLGFIPNGTVTIDGSGNQVLNSEDRNTLEVDSVYNTLIRLRQALENSDSEAIGRAVERLDVDLDRATFARGEIGTRLQTLDVVQTRLEDENVQLQSALSNEIDVDLIEAISNLTARQYALQASLQTAASILNLSILDYI
jgi:flagellar hook-associated protein 3 FlgL